MKKYIDEAGRSNVAALVTDNASNMRAARELVVSDPEYRHIIILRCGQWAGPGLLLMHLSVVALNA